MTQVPIGTRIKLEDDFEASCVSTGRLYTLKNGVRGVYGSDGYVHLYDGNVIRGLGFSNNVGHDAKGIASFVYERLINSDDTKETFERIDDGEKQKIAESIETSLKELGFRKMF